MNAPNQRPALESRPSLLSVAMRRAFTLVEMLVAMVVLSFILLMMITLTDQASRIWKGSRVRVDAFQAARNAFGRIVSHLGQATLATYYDYYDNTGKSRSESASPATFIPSKYDRASELQFVSGQAATLIPPTNSGVRPTHAVFFQAPLGYVSTSTDIKSDFKGLNSVLNGTGYYIEFSDDSTLRPSFFPTGPASWRYRLMELYQPSQNLGIYYLKQQFSDPIAAFQGVTAWFNQAVGPLQLTSSSTKPTIVTADNIVALIVRPESSSTATSATYDATTDIAPNYAYDTKAYLSNPLDPSALKSKNQLPPLVRITMVAIDADSALQLANRFGANPPPLCEPTAFTSTAKYDDDLAALVKTLQAFHLSYRVFVTDVSIHGAQWSQTAPSL